MRKKYILVNEERGVKSERGFAGLVPVE